METIINFAENICTSEPFLLALTIVAYYVAQVVYTRTKMLLFHPILIASLMVIGVLTLIDVDYESYNEANGVINLLLNISVICLSYLMYKNIKRINEYRLSIMLSTFMGSFLGIVSIIGLCYLFNCDEVVMLSLQPKSVTSAIAVSLSESIGGIPALSSLAVVVAGIGGSVIGPRLLQIFGITDPIAKGTALGSASHAVGTARALEMGAVEGAVGGVSICLMGLFTSILTPIINAFL